MPSVFWHCWLGGRKGIRPVKRVVGCWRGYLSAARCRLVWLSWCYCSKIQIGFTVSVLAHLGSPGKRAVKRVCVCVCVCFWRIIMSTNRRLGRIWKKTEAYHWRLFDRRTSPVRLSQLQIYNLLSTNKKFFIPVTLSQLSCSDFPPFYIFICILYVVFLRVLLCVMLTKCRIKILS